MKKIPSVLFLISFFVTLIFLLWNWFLGEYNHYEYREEFSSETQRNFTKAEIGDLLEEAAGEDGVLSEDEAFSLIPSEARGFYRAAAKGDKESILFFVKVVDQYGLSVSDAFVRIDVGGGFISGGKQGEVRTDENGLAAIAIDGSFVMIEDVTHPQIEYVAPKSPRGEMFYGFQPGSAGGAKLWKDYQVEGSPYLIKVWRFRDLPELSSGCDGSYHLASGSNRTIFLNPPRGQKSVLKGNHQAGQLIYSLYVDPQAEDTLSHDSAPRKWRFSISAIAGGLAFSSEEDVYLNQAPEAGYQSSWSTGGASKPYDSRIDVGPIYFVAHDGREFGVIKFGLSPVYPGTEKSSIRFCYKSNMSGSTDLQSDQSWYEGF